MNKNPKTLSSLIPTGDRRLAGGLLAAALIGCAGFSTYASDANREGIAVAQQTAPKHTVSGIVVDENGDPLAGVSVMVKGTKTGISTNLDGEFSLSVPSGATLEFSYIGYKSTDIAVNGRSSIDVKLEPDTNMLDEVVAIGYGAVKKRDLTGAVSSVSADVITLTPSSNPMDALQGRVAGLDITRESGQPGAGVSIQLRGNRSITASGTPLFIIDGMPGHYETINPNDIESIEVLKDASSTAVYGSEGSNGVVIINTKKGQEGKMRVSFDAYLGVNGWSSTPKMNSPEQNIYTRELAYKQSGSVVDDSKLNAYKAALAAGQTIDWVDELLGTGFTQNYSLSMSGGTERTQAYFSLNYSDEQGQYKNDSYKVYSTSIRLNTKLNNWLSGGVHVQASYSNRNTAKIRLDRGLMADPFGTLYLENGELNPLPLTENPDLVNLLLNTSKSAYRDSPSYLYLYVQPYVRITPIKGLTLESRLSGKFNYTTKNVYKGYGSYDYYVAAGTGAQNPDFYDPSLTEATIDNSRNWGYTWENILTYNFKIGDIHDFTLTGVTSWSSSQTEASGMKNTGIPSNSMYWTNMGKATGRPSVTSAYSMHKRMGYVGRINYTLMGRYLFSASVRRDGDSRLAQDRHWATFPAVSAGWRISDEAFMESTRDYLNNLKLRVGYGETGGAGINPYDSWSILSTGQMALGGVLVDIARYPQMLSNATLTWERSKSWNIGLDLGLFNNRIDLAAEYYITNTDDVIWTQEVPIINGGFDSKTPFEITRNIATTRNQGFELSLNTRNIVTRDFTWSSTLTFSTNKEKVTSLGEGAADYVEHGDYCLHVGDPLKSFRDYDFAGIWQLGEEADAAAFGRRPGDIKVNVPDIRKISDGVWEKTRVDENGELVTEVHNAENPYSYNANDKVIIGHNTPDWSLGFQNTFTYKWFDLSIYMYWRNGQKFKYDPMGWYDNNGGSFPEFFDYWTTENPSNDFPALDSSRDWRQLQGASGRYWVDGSFFKIKNITLGYTLPAIACSKVGISKLRVYGTITNPLVHASSKFLKDYDPEANGSFNNPLTKQLVFGLNVTF